MAEKIIDISGGNGLAPRYFGDRPFDSDNAANRTYRVGDNGKYVGGVVNPIARLGYLSPAVETYEFMDGDDIMVAASATIVDTIAEKNYYLSEGSGSTVSVQSSWVTSSLTELNIIAGVSVKGTDLELYTVNGIRKLFYSYRTNAAGNIGIYDLAATFDDDFMSTVPAGATALSSHNHRMTVADNGFMYILDGNALHKFDGTVTGGAGGTMTPNVLVFPVTFQLIDFIDLRGKLWINVLRSTRNLNRTTIDTSSFTEYCGVYIWDRQSTTSNMADFIVIDGVKDIRHIVSFQGVPHVFTTSSANYTQLRSYNGNEFGVLLELDPDAYPKYHDSIHNTGSLLMWLGFNGLMYAWGKIDPVSQENNQLYIIGDFTNSGPGVAFNYGAAIVSAISGLGPPTGENNTREAFVITCSTGFGGTGKLWYPHYMVDTANANVFPNAGNFFTEVIPLPKLTEVVSATIFYYPSATSGNTTCMSVDLYFNQSATSWGSTPIKGSDGPRGFKFWPIGKKNANFIQIGISYNTAVAMENQIYPMYILFELADKATKKK